MNGSDPEDSKHFDAADAQEGETGISWFEETPTIRLTLTQALRESENCLIDVGSEASRLVANTFPLGFCYLKGKAVVGAKRTMIHNHLDHCLEQTIGPLSRDKRGPVDELKEIAKSI